ncbi:MAG: hypothetical protein CMC96_04690 [Flavobacteriales bacterium]|nr:hypothetical protein [Flavobacteriales bacterium]|tara:strand:+ start:30123 stop:31190 length:1068 start_codon:yes stop_codon:yes gene_type:complete
MKKNYFLLPLTLLTATLFAQNTTTSDGLWNTAANWSNGVPTPTELVNVNNDMTLNRDLQIDNGGEYYIFGSAIDPVGGNTYAIQVQGSGILDISGKVEIQGNFNAQNNSQFYLRSGDTLIVGGDANFQNNSELTIETGAVFLIKGNLNLQNNNATLLNGNMYVEGDVEAKNKATIDGTGSFQSDGQVVIGNKSSLFGSTSYCPGTCEYGSGAGLPIELKSFEASLNENNKKLVEVKWTTLSEINNIYFIIEYSTDGKNFNEVDQVEGAGNSNRELNYSRVIQLENIGSENYFRLKQVDYDGSSKTFNAVSLQKSNSTSKFSNKADATIYPNPSNGNQLKVSLENFEAGQYDLALT